MSPHLRLAPRAGRPSVVVDMRAEEPRFTSPLTLEEIHAMQTRGARVPHRVFVAMYTAAWAAAEGCDLAVHAGRLEPSCRYEPTEALWAAVARGMGGMVGALGFAVPVQRDRHHVATGATWPSAMWWGGS